MRPEEVAEWRAIGACDAVGGSFDRSPEAQAQAAELAVERAKRRVERGGHAVVVVDSLDALPAGARRRVFGAGARHRGGRHAHRLRRDRRGPEALRWATTRIVLEPGGRVGAESGALRADALTSTTSVSAIVVGWTRHTSL